MHSEYDGGEGEDDGGHPDEAEVHEEVDRVMGEDSLQPVRVWLGLGLDRVVGEDSLQ